MIIPFPGVLLESFAEHETAFPFGAKIPHNKLLLLNQAYPYELTGHWRLILYSGFLQSYLFKSHKDCVVNPFHYSNVGVIKGFNILGFKKFDRIVGKENGDHWDYSNFVEDTFNKFCGPSSLLQFPECEDFLKACTVEPDDEFLRHHSFFVEDELLADLYSDIHRLLRHQFKHRRLGPQAKQILLEMGQSFRNQQVVYDCGRHILLHSLLGCHCPVERKKLLLEGVVNQPPHEGSAIVDLNRNAVQHAIEEKVLDAALRKYPQDRDLVNSYSRLDLIKALRHVFKISW